MDKAKSKYESRNDHLNDLDIPEERLQWIVQDNLSDVKYFKILAKGRKVKPIGHPWTTWLKHILFGLLILAAIVIFASFISGCKSPYPPCTTVGNYRCNGQTVEACDGRNWNPVNDCKQLYYMGDELAEIFFCEEISETRADCLPASDGGI